MTFSRCNAIFGYVRDPEISRTMTGWLSTSPAPRTPLRCEPTCGTYTVARGDFKPKKKHNSRGRRHTPQWLKREDEVEVASRALHMGPRENVFQNRTTRGKYTPTPISWSATPVRGSVDPDLEKRGVHRARAPGCSERKKKPAVEDTTMRLGTDGLSTWVLGRGRGFFLVSPTLAYIHPRNNGHRNDNTGETRTAQLFRVHRHMLVPWKGVARNYQHTHLDRI